ncbi:MAG: HAD-IC family P-type ATPase [Clostridia bacterium]|nr:HAD-IC family P-type ATPase [Clostridia bacterium]
MSKSNTQQQIVRYEPDYDVGLNDQQVIERVNQGLKNKVTKKYSKSYWSILVNNVFTFFNLLGLIVFIALLSIKASIGNFFFVFFYVSNSLIGVIQEIRAKKCIDKLSLLTSKTTKVLRNSQIIDILPEDIVLDDVVVLGLGNQVPTDGLILNGDVEVNESLLTGESVPIKKTVGDTLLAGSFVISGKCTLKADKVGADNYVETLSAKAKEYKKPKSEIMNTLKAMIKVISFIIVPLATAHMLRSTLMFKETLSQAILHTSPIVIGVIPAGMFLLTSVALAIGIVKLARHNTLVQDLYSLEMLARVDTICFDKTGTITDGKMTVTQVISLNEDNLDIKDVMSSMLGTVKDENQTANALTSYFGNKVIYNSDLFIPFNSKRKLTAVSYTDYGTYAFGAPEFILSKEKFSTIKSLIDSHAQKGLRVLLYAKSNQTIIEEQLPKDFTPIALILLADNVREEAVKTVQWFKDNDVTVKVISGDNPVTVSEVSSRVGILNADKYVSLEGKTDKEVYELANEYTVFGRVSPEQKAILVKAMKDSGHVTAMTGDGVNDILALKEADCAISVAAGSDAARNVSHLVLLDNNFNSMPKIVSEGRRVINNVQSSSSLFFMKTLFTMIISIIVLFLPNVETYPFQLPQLIMLEIVVIGTPAFFLSLQPNDSRVEGKFISYVLKNSLPSAIIMALSVAIAHSLNFIIPTNEQSITTLSVFALTFAGLLSLFFICRPFNKFRTIIFLSSLIVVFAVLTCSILVEIPILELIRLYPLERYWPHFITLLISILIEIPVLLSLKRICTKIFK